MFPRRPIIHVLALSALLTALAGPASAGTYNPSASPAATLNTASFSWSAGAGAPYIIALSTASNFSVKIATGSFSALTTTYLNLGQDTTYYFRVKRQAQTDASYESVSADTFAADPTGLYSMPPFFTAESSYTATISAGWSPNGNPEWTRYEVSSADNPAFTGEAVSPMTNPQGAPKLIGGLSANTTYYLRVRTRGINGTAGSYTPQISTATLAVKLEGLDEGVFETSATISWLPVNAAAMPLDSEGYRLHVSTNANDLITPATVYWQTGDHNAESADLSPLARNTEYSYRIGTLNWAGNSNLREIRSFTTLALQPQSPAVLSVSSFSASVGWTALAPGAAAGYQLEASSTDFNGTGAVLYTAGYDLAQSTLTVTGLDANTTYYFRAASLNLDYDPNYSLELSSITLTVPPTPNLPTIVPYMYDITVQLSPLPGTLQRNSCEGYLLEASSTAFNGKGVVYSSATADPFQVSLDIPGLTPNVTYSLRLATLNWTRTPNYSQLTPTVTVLPPAPAGPRLTGVWQSSATITFNATAGGQSYMIEASTYSSFSYIHRSSATTNVSVGTLTVTGLDENTVYYFRAGASYSGVAVYNYTTPPEQQTLPLTLALATPQFTGVFYSSATMAWTPLAGSPPKATADSYRLEASTSPDFALVQFSSASLGTTAAWLTLSGLSPNTSYYFRAAAVNLEGNASYAVAPATATLANPPVPQAFGLTPQTMTLNWLANSNPPDTLYYAELSADPAFSAPASSSTRSVYAAFTGLTPNTTYYTRVTAINRLNRAIPAVSFQDMATAAYDPVAAPFSDIGASSMTVNWQKGLNPAGVTQYQVQISSSHDSSGTLYGTVLSSVTYNLYAVFGGMVSNASYYMQVSALNYTGMPSPPVSLGTALTLPATPYMLAPEQAFTAGMIDGFTVNWLDNGNSSATVYDVMASTDPAFSMFNSSLSVNGLSCGFKGLLPDTTYWLQVRAEGQTRLQSAYELAGSTKTLLASLLNAVALQSNVITLQTSYGVISVSMPAGSIGSSTRMTLEPLYSFPAPVSAVSELTPTGVGLAITYFPSTLVLNAITITLPYRLADLPPGTDRSRLILAYYDDTRSVWVPLPSVSDTAHNQVIGQTWHLSTFQIMQAKSEAGLSEVKIYPNPYRPNSVSDVMHFTNMPPYAKVKVYTFLGELVREVKADVNGMAHWDGLNANGRKAASGVYIAFIQTSDKKSSKSFKIAVER
jgi:hypothetical protein